MVCCNTTQAVVFKEDPKGKELWPLDMADSGDLEIFVEVVRRGNFAVVAKDRNVAPSSVSRVIATLESELGVRLFHRTTRALALTEAGTIFYEQIEPLVTQLRGAQYAAVDASEDPRGPLRIAAGVGFGQRCLVPLLRDFSAQYPKLSLEVTLTDEYINIIEDGIDIAICSEVPSDKELTSCRLLDTTYVVCASPAYLSVRESIARPAQLEDCNCLCLRWHFGGEQCVWLFKSLAAQGILEVPVSGTVTTGSDVALRECALAAMGVVLLPDWLVASDIRTGSLVRVLPDYLATATVFDTAAWIVHPYRAYVPRKVRAFSGYLKTNLRPNVDRALA